MAPLAMITLLHHRLVGPDPFFALATTVISLGVVVAAVVWAVRSQRS